MKLDDTLSKAQTIIEDALSPIPDGAGGVDIDIVLNVNLKYSVNGSRQNESITLNYPYDLAYFKQWMDELGKRVLSALKAQ